MGCRRRGSLVTFRRKGSAGRPWLPGGASLFMPVAGATPIDVLPCFRCCTMEMGEGEEGRGWRGAVWCFVTTQPQIHTQNMSVHVCVRRCQQLQYHTD